jgi:hypothetical protein
VQCLVFAQTKSLQIPLGEDENVLSYYQVNENGLFVTSGILKYQKDKPVYKFAYYDKDLMKVWETTQERKEKSQNLHNYLIYSPQQKYIYHIEGIGFFNLESLFITQFDATGKKKETTVEIDNDNFKSGGIFADEETLFIVKKMENNTHEILTIDHKSLNKKTGKIDFPKVPEVKGQKDFFSWRFEGQKDGLFYFSLKSVDTEKNEIAFRIAKIRPNGSLAEEFKITVKQEGDNYMKPIDFRSTPDIGYLGWDGARGTSRDGEKSIGEITLDLKNEVIYIYGLLGEKPFKRNWQGDAMFINLYDLQGKSKKKINMVLPEDLADGFGWKSCKDWTERGASFVIEPDNGFSLSIFFNFYLYTMEFNSRGNYKEYTRCPWKHGGSQLLLNSCRSSFAKSKVYPFFAKRQDDKKYKDSRYSNMIFSDREFVFESNDDQEIFQIHLFK